MAATCTSRVAGHEPEENSSDPSALRGTEPSHCHVPGSVTRSTKTWIGNQFALPGNDSSRTS